MARYQLPFWRQEILRLKEEERLYFECSIPFNPTRRNPISDWTEWGREDHFAPDLIYLLKPFEGEISFKGEKINSNHSIFDYRRKLALVFQEPLLFDTTVFENVASGLKIRGMKQARNPEEGDGTFGAVWYRPP